MTGQSVCPTPPRGLRAATEAMLSALPATGWLVLLGVASAILWAALYLPVGPRGHLPAAFEARFAAYPLLFAAYFLACFIAWTRREQLTSAGTTIGVILGALAFRLLVLSAPVIENGDNWRYLWEGRVVLEGMNPYAAPPDGPRYAGLRRKLDRAGDDLFGHLLPSTNSVRSVYGPVATGLFVVPSLLPFDRISTLRVLLTCFDLGTVLVIMAWLRSLGRPPVLALVYAWNPVCLNAFADRAQIDGAMVFLLALAGWLACTRRPTWAGVAFGVALLVKVSPLLVALPFIRAGRARFAAPLAAVLALGAIPFVMAGPGSLSGFGEFAARWHNIDSIHGLVLLALEPLSRVVDVAPIARGLVMLAAWVYAIWRTLSGSGLGAQWLLEACAAIAGAGLLLSPVVHPWYTTNLVVFLCFAPNAGLLLLPCATMSWFVRFWVPPAGSLARTMLIAGRGYYEPWRWVAYPPVYALLFWEWWRGRKVRGLRSPSAVERAHLADALAVE